MKIKFLCGLIASTLIATGCATGDNYRADVYRSGQVNQQQEVEIVTIMMVAPAKVAVDNSKNQKVAQVGGAILGAVTGALLGRDTSHQTASGVGGAAVGGVVGTLVPSEVLVDGVSLTYKKAGSDKVLNSAQVGRVCEFKKGKAMMVSTDGKETRIQPNNPNGCDVEKNKRM